MYGRRIWWGVRLTGLVLLVLVVLDELRRLYHLTCRPAVCWPIFVLAVAGLVWALTAPLDP